MRIITGPPGLGDLIWVVMKLINANEKFIWRMPDGQPQRGHQLFELLPQITHSWYYDRIRFNNVRAWNISRERLGVDRLRWADINSQDFFLECNTLLESGQRIENFLPDLKTSFKIDYQTTEEHKNRAINLLPIFENYKYYNKKLIGIYMSSVGTNISSETWLADEWKEFLKLMSEEYKCHFVFFAAKWDSDLLEKVTNPYPPENYTVFLDEPLGAVIEAFKQLDYLIGFQSGMNIINETLGKDGLMLYRRADRRIINTWGDPARIKSGQLKECLFDTPEKIFGWIKTNKPF